MNRSRSLPLSLAFALAIVSGSASGVELDRIASFSTDAPPPCYDVSPEVASQPGGSFLLLWGRVGCSPGISSLHRALRFDAAGRRLGEEVELWYGQDTALVPLPDGGFVAASAREITGEGPAGSIRLHRLDPLGRPVGDPILVIQDHDEFVTSTEPRLAVAPNGTVAVVWTTFNWTSPGSILAMGRFFDASLAPLTEAFPLSFIALGAQATPDVAFAGDSTALAVWAQSPDYFLYRGIYGRRFDTSGHPMSEAFPISLEDSGQQMYDARVVAGASGGWWAAWSRFGTSQPREARLVRLGPDGGLLLAEQSLGLPQSDLSRPALGTYGTGQALLLGRSPDGRIVGRLFDDTDLSASSPFVLTEGNDRSFMSPALSDRNSAGLVAAWYGFLPSDVTSSDLFGAILAPACLEGKSAACLGPEARYGVEVAWQIGAQSGTAKPLPLAGNVATFGLRNAADHDVTVLLSGSGSRDLTYAATTGAALKIRVTDKTTGAIRTFSKPAGRFASGRFPNALPGLSSGPDDPATASFFASDTTEVGAPEIRPSVGETCVPTSRALCLLGGRFRAELFGGQSTRPALALLRTDKSGAFAFPSAPEKPVVTVTMIDGRAGNGKFWVYLGDLSDGAYRVMITDSVTGKVKIYTKPAGRLLTRVDRQAF